MLRAQVEHLLLEYRMVILKSRIEQLGKQLATAGDDDKERLLTEMMQLTAMRQEIAKRLGKSIIV